MSDPLISDPTGNDPLLAQRSAGRTLPPPSASVPPQTQPTRPTRPTRQTKRTKPAKGTKMAAAAMSLVTTAGLAGLFANTGPSTDSVILTAGTAPATTASPSTTPATAPTTPAPTTPPVVAQTTAAAETTVAAATTVPAPVGIADGTYVGAGSQNKWGIVQVQVVYSGGAIADVQILQYPNSENKSVRINQRSLPTLISEAITTQSANVDGVSGATYTSQSYVASLQSAIDAAKSASGVTA